MSGKELLCAGCASSGIFAVRSPSNLDLSLHSLRGHAEMSERMLVVSSRPVSDAKGRRQPVACCRSFTTLWIVSV